MNALYDRIGTGYTAKRRADPRIAARLRAALGEARSVLNVGAGTGSYEPKDLAVIAVEPSAAMIAGRRPRAAPVLKALAEALPFADASFDAAMAVLTIHHWHDQSRGLVEMARVSRGRIVLLTFDPAFRQAWLNDYVPQLADLDDEQMPTMDTYARLLGPVDITPVPVPHDCRDGFLYAWWRRPEAYLDPAVRAASSSFWKIEGASDGLARLAADLDSGAWMRRYGHLLALDSLDVGYRLVVARSGPTAAPAAPVPPPEPPAA
jgi:SAM-dependent methyltransferase